MRLSTSKASLPGSRFERESSEFDRSLGFFDATYAFALTLLILNIDLPKEDAWQSVSTLTAAISWQAVGFITSFVVIIIFWMSNNAVISRLRVLDTVTIYLNILVLGFVIFVPFTTQAISDPNLGELPLPTIVYALNVGLAISVQGIMYEVAMARGYGLYERSSSTRLWERIDSFANPAVFFLSIPVSLLWGGVAGKLTWLLMIPVGIITGRRAGRAELADLQKAEKEQEYALPVDDGE